MPPETRAALIDAATRLLDDGGVEAVTLREVGRLAGVSHNAPYKHFPSKAALLAAIAARELTRRNEAMTAAALAPEVALRAALHDYVAWARDYPARFKLVFGTWSIDDAGLGAAATAAQTTLVGLVSANQDAGALPAGDPVRLASLLRAVVHGAAGLAAAGHLAADGKGHASPADLVDDVMGYLRTAAVT